MGTPSMKKSMTMEFKSSTMNLTKSISNVGKGYYSKKNGGEKM